MQRYVARKGQWRRCRGGSGADIEGVEDTDDAERSGVEGVDGAAGVFDDAGGSRMLIVSEG